MVNETTDPFDAVMAAMEQMQGTFHRPTFAIMAYGEAMKVIRKQKPERMVRRMMRLHSAKK